MSFEIEDVPIVSKQQTRSVLQEFVETVSELQVGQSFVLPATEKGVSGGKHTALQVIGILLDRQFRTQKVDATHYRIGRVS